MAKLKDGVARTQFIRMRSGKTKEVLRLTKGTAIKVFCSECLGWETPPKECTSINCALYLYRGKSLLANDKEDKEEE